MRRISALLAAFVFASFFLLGATAFAGPSGSTQCHLQDDDCDGTIDEDPVGDANGDGLADDDGDGVADEDDLGDAADDPNENQMDCNESSSTSAAGVGYVYAGSNGAEVCADEGSSAPIDGSATVDAEEGYVAIDGDNSNPAPANGYARVDDGGVHCGDETNQDSSADQSENTIQDCG
jgi:hypothetical protein